MFVLLIIGTALVVCGAIWGPEQLSKYRDRYTLNKIQSEAVEGNGEGYRYSLNNNEKLYILSKCLTNQVLPESDASALTKVQTDMDYNNLTGNYAFVVNHQEPSDKEITEEQVYERCNEELAKMYTLGILPEEVRGVTAATHSATLYSAIDVLEPRNNLSVWKISLRTGQQNANKEGCLLDVYMDADTGLVYEFYVRTANSTWADIDSDGMVEKWSAYLGLTGQENYDDTNPLLETTSDYKKYKFAGVDNGNTIVTVGFYEGINELFLKISR
ncbi:MAG: hypothetical protein K2N89_07925 [Lachnospiraceae bacterium]|nr:hypothetical protein [Lachnospiraceae bacterium]